MREIKNKKEVKIWQRVLELLLAYKKYFPGIFICLVCTSFMTFLQPLVIQRITDQGMVGKDMKCILLYSGALVCTALIYQVTEALQTRLFSNIHNGLTFSLYKKAYWKMSKLKIGYYDEKGSAEIANTVGADISNVASVADQITTFSIGSFLQIIGGIVGLSLLDWKLALLIVLVIPMKFIIVYYFAKKKNCAFERLIENNRMFSGWLGDCINGIREMKLWDLFRVKNKDFERLQKKMMGSYRENLMLDQYRTMGVSMLDALLNAALYILGGLLIIKGEFTIGGAFAFITYSGYVVSPITFLINIKYYFAQIGPSAKRLFAFLEQPEEEGDLLDKNLSTRRNIHMETNTPILALKNVRFGYRKGIPILKGVNLLVQQGEKIAVIGENGCGKSTLLNLLSGFYQPEQGEIEIGGVPMKILKLEDIRSRIAVVSQKPYLFQGTIEENINMDGTALHEEVVNACKKSGAITFIEKLEKGFMQHVGLNGAKLSGGERQKLAVARAMLKKADVILMDEATSGFDQKSDNALIKLICEELNEKAVIFITHRYEELEGVEKVYKLSDGILELQT